MLPPPAGTEFDLEGVSPGPAVLSPDGNSLAFISEGAVWVVPIHGQVDPDIAGEPVRLAEVPDVWDNGSLMAWSANGEWIAVNGGSESVEGALDASMTMKQARQMASREEAVETLVKMVHLGELSEGDWILVKGSRGMRMETIIESLKKAIDN